MQKCLDSLPKKFLKAEKNENTYDKFLTFTCALKSLGDDYQNIWNTFCENDGTKYEREKNYNIWNNALPQDYPHAISWLLNQTIWSAYNVFARTRPNEIEPNEVIDQRYLMKHDKDMHVFKERFVVIKSPMGTGKTRSFTYFMKYIQSEAPSVRFLSIVSRKSLAQEHHNVL